VYTIRESARAVGRSVGTLRRWERDGLVKPPAHRDRRTNARLYTSEELRELIKFVGRDDGPRQSSEPVMVQ